MIPHLEMGMGTYFPNGGMISITNSLVKLAIRQGVKFHFGKPVSQIIIKNGHAAGVVIEDKKVTADYVVSNMDIFSTYRKLLSHQPQPEKILAQERSSSALIFYWGMKKSFPNLDLHNIFFSNSYEDEFQAIFNHKSLHPDPTVYINISSKCNPNDAPEGGENWFVMINTPGDFGQDWETIIYNSRNRIQEKISNVLGKDITKFIATEEILDPRLIEKKTFSHKGALYGTSSNNRYAAFLRHPNFSKKIENLYFCGGSVHPGGGIPLCLHSAKIVSNLF
jgi:phytoene desaturase